RLGALPGNSRPDYRHIPVFVVLGLLRRRHPKAMINLTKSTSEATDSGRDVRREQSSTMAYRRRSDALRHLRQYWWIYLILTVFGALLTIPLLWLISSSLKAEGQLFVMPPEWIPEPV